jgi:hypothetical protein
MQGISPSERQDAHAWSTRALLCIRPQHTGAHLCAASGFGAPRSRLGTAAPCLTLRRLALRQEGGSPFARAAGGEAAADSDGLDYPIPGAPTAACARSALLAAYAGAWLGLVPEGAAAGGANRNARIRIRQRASVLQPEGGAFAAPAPSLE